jgi:hypothetical protein
MIDVLGQDEIDLGEQLLGRGARCPRRKAALSRSGPFGAAKENMIGHDVELLVTSYSRDPNQSSR